MMNRPNQKVFNIKENIGRQFYNVDYCSLNVIIKEP